MCIRGLVGFINGVRNTALTEDEGEGKTGDVCTCDVNFRAFRHALRRALEKDVEIKLSALYVVIVVYQEKVVEP
jgi:hypothetical protein